MRETVRRAVLLLFPLVCAVPMFAGSIAADITLPATGHLVLPNDLVYRTEVVLTNHRDVLQYVQFELIQGGHASMMTIFPMNPKETKFLPQGGFPGGGGLANLVGAMRIRAIDGVEGSPDPNGQLDAKAFIIADRGRFATDGSSRQEIEAIPSTEYFAEEAVFLGVRHSLGTGIYTNVGIVNMHPTQTETFYVRFQYGEPEPVVVPPLSVRQIRVSAPGSGGRYVYVYPEWAIGDGPPARTTPWVAYASSVDMKTGDAFSGIRAPSTTRYDFPDD